MHSEDITTMWIGATVIVFIVCASVLISTAIKQDCVKYVVEQTKSTEQAMEACK